MSWGRPQFSLFYPNFGPLSHLQYMEIHKNTFPWSCRYCKYLSFAALVTPITFLGAEQFAFPCTLFSPELQLKKFWAWAETKTGLCWGRITAKASDEFQRNWIFNREHTKQKHQFYRVGHTLKVMFLFCVFSIKDPISLKLVRWATSGKYLKPLARLIKRCCKSSNTHWNTYIKLTAATTAPRWCCQKIYLFTKKVIKISLEWKSMFIAYSHFNNFFVTHGHIPAIFNFLDITLSELSHSQSPRHSKTYLQKLEIKIETHFILWQS